MDNEHFDRSDETAVLRAGQILELRCTAKGGNPIPTLAFTQNGVPFGPDPRPFQNTYTWTITAHDNNAVLACAAQNEADRPAERSKVRLNVLCKYIKNA